MNMPVGAPSSMVMTRIGGHDYPLRSIPNCHTCQSPHRLRIEQMLLAGRSYVAIAREISGLEPGPSLPHPTSVSISHHARNNHMPIEVSARRALIERRAEEIGKSIENSVESLVDYKAANELIVQRGLERMLSGEIDVDTPDLIQAIKVQATLDKKLVGDADVEAWKEAMMVYFEVAQQFVPEELWEAFGQALSRNKVLKGILERQQQQQAELLADG